MATKRRHKSRFKVWHAVVGVIVLALIFVGVFVVVNRQNITAIYKAATTSSEELANKQEENRKKTQEILDSLTDADIRELPDEVREKMKTGEITEEESLAIIMGDMTVNEVMGASGEGENSSVRQPADNKPIKSSGGDKQTDKIENQNTQPTNGGDTEGNKNSNTKKKEELIAKIYLLRADYLNQIDGFIESSIAALKRIPAEEFTFSKKMSLVSQYASRGAEMEASCDVKMEGLLAELKNVLEESGESTAPVEEIRRSYEEQKQLKKEELFSEYYPD